MLEARPQQDAEGEEHAVAKQEDLAGKAVEQRREMAEARVDGRDSQNHGHRREEESADGAERLGEGVDAIEPAAE